MTERTDNRIILLVEDDPDHEALTIRALRRSNVRYEVVVTHDGAEALDYLFGQGPFAERDLRILPHFVVLDLKLPKIDGLEVLKQIKQDASLKTIPVVMLTSSREEVDVIASYTGGVNAYVVKPVEFDRFVRALQELGMFWAVLNEPPPGGVVPRRDVD